MPNSTFRWDYISLLARCDRAAFMEQCVYFRCRVAGAPHLKTCWFVFLAEIIRKVVQSCISGK